jgi:hypothetical protein
MTVPRSIEIALNHSRQLWEAEEEVARALQLKRNIAITQVGVIIGFVVHSINPIPIRAYALSTWLSVVVVVLAGAALFFLVIALARLLTLRSQERGFASVELPLPDDQIDALLQGDLDAAELAAECMIRTAKAGEALQRRNIGEVNAQKEIRNRICIAVLLIGVSVILFVIDSIDFGRFSELVSPGSEVKGNE